MIEKPKSILDSPRGVQGMSHTPHSTDNSSRNACMSDKMHCQSATQNIKPHPQKKKNIKQHIINLPVHIPKADDHVQCDNMQQTVHFIYLFVCLLDLWTAAPFVHLRWHTKVAIRTVKALCSVLWLPLERPEPQWSLFTREKNMAISGLNRLHYVYRTKMHQQGVIDLISAT